VIDTKEYRWNVWLRWLEGWLRAGWRPIGVVCRARDRHIRVGGQYRTLLIAEICRTLASALTVIALVAVAVFLLVGCGDNRVLMEDLPRTAPCTDYEAYMVSVDEDVVPSLVPAPAGIRVVVDADFRPFMGSSYPVPGGRMVWNVWVFRWYDGDHLGAIGRVGDTTQCRWYEPHISG
jgi:hypothetical protein